MNTFPKKEHLYGEKNITRLHEQGTVFMSFPFRVVHMLAGEDEIIPVRMMVSVPKKRFKLAVKRNRIKRLIRETYRLNKMEIIDFAIAHDLKLYISFQYVSNDIETFEMINKRMKNAIKKLMYIYQKPDQKPDEND